MDAAAGATMARSLSAALWARPHSGTKHFFIAAVLCPGSSRATPACVDSAARSSGDTCE